MADIRRFDPNQPRDPDGKWGDGIPGPDLDMEGFDLISEAEGTFGTLQMGVDDVGDVRMAFHEGSESRAVDLGSDEVADLGDVLERLAARRADLPDDADPSGVYDDDRFGFDNAHKVELFGSGVISVTFGAEDEDPYALDLDPPNKDSDDVQSVLDAIGDVMNEVDVMRSTAVGELRKFNPAQPREPGGDHGGQWVKNPIGAAADAAEHAIDADELDLAWQIDLNPDEHLVASDVFYQRGAEYELNAAIIKGRNGHEVRLGVTHEDDSWPGDSPDTLHLDAERFRKLHSDLANAAKEGNRAASDAQKAWDAGAPPTDPRLLGSKAVAEGGISDGGTNLNWAIHVTDDDPTSWQMSLGAEDGGELTLNPRDTTKLLKFLRGLDAHLDAPAASRSRQPIPARSTTGGGLMDVRPGKPYGDASYADPGYQQDGKARYPLDSEEHCRAAWSYINMPKNSAMYTAEQLTSIKDRIKAAGKKYGIDFGEDGRSFQPEEHPRAPAGSSTGGEFAKAGAAAKKAAASTVKAKSKSHHGSSARKPDNGTLAYDAASNHGTGYDSQDGDPRVHDLQRALNRLGVTDAAGKTLRDDGQLGPKTTAAVKKLQTLLGVRPDGKVTPALLAQIKSMKSLPQKRSGFMDSCVRSFGFEFEERAAGDGRTLEGYAAVFNSPATIRDVAGDFEETILPGAFKRSLARRTPILQWDHGKDPRVGTVPIGAIEALSEDSRGLHVRARLFDNPVVEPVRQAIEGGAVSGMSFRFGVPAGGDDWPTRDKRQIRAADVHELGPVAFPAYDTTSVTVRSLLAQLDPAEYRSLLRELAAELRLAVDLTDLTGVSDARSADRGDIDLVAPSSGGRSALSPEVRALEAEALHALGVL